MKPSRRLLVALAGLLCVGAWALPAAMPAGEATAQGAPAAAGPAQGYTESGLIRAPVLGQFGGTVGPVLPPGLLSSGPVDARGGG